MRSLKDFSPIHQTFFSDLDQRAEINQATLSRLQAEGAFEYSPQRNFPWVLKESRLPWMPLAIDYPWQDMLKEAENVLDEFVGHRTGGEAGTYEGNEGWKAVCLHGIDKHKTHDCRIYGYPSDAEAPHQWTEIADRCPITTAFLKEHYPCDVFHRVRYIMLEPGGCIYPHIDGTHKLLWYVNFALNNPEGFHFKMTGQGYIPFAPGRAFMLDTFNEHALVNMSDQPRIHMIIHGNPLRHIGFHELVERSYRQMCENPQRFAVP